MIYDRVAAMKKSRREYAQRRRDKAKKEKLCYYCLLVPPAKGYMACDDCRELKRLKHRVGLGRETRKYERKKV